MQKFFDNDFTALVEWVYEQWDIQLVSIRIDARVQGSPQRVLHRQVYEDACGRLFLLEAFEKKRFVVRDTVARAVYYLNRNGLETALCYQKTRKEQFLPFRGQVCFGLMPYVEGVPILRPQYLQDQTIGLEFARFLGALQGVSCGIDQKVQLSSFNLKSYINHLFLQMQTHDPAVCHRFYPFLEVLNQQFMKVYQRFPVAFCHGDLHPSNVIWSKEKILAVIDWEFCGIKPQMYDTANFLGCAGIDDPEGLVGPMVMHFICEMRKQGGMKSQWWRFLPEFILALRFAWLSEWLRDKDSRMIEMEAAYMEVLVTYSDSLRSAWGIA